MKAISLFSGGLDSQLAVCLIKEQNIEVIAVNFTTPFFGAEESTVKAARDLGIELVTINFGEEYLDVLKNPVYGYGKHMNPCIDCHAYMEKRAAQYMYEVGANFLISGEVVGQRPMSQTKSSLNAVDKLADMKGLMVRPLSAKLLKPSIAEEKGWIDRDKLLDISGRSRTRQMALAEQYGLKDYPTPAGGCLLTQENFSNRLKRYLEKRPESRTEELMILRYGRHFYIGDHQLLMVGRNQAENNSLIEHANEGDIFIKVLDLPGPIALLRPGKALMEEDILLSARITARYSDSKGLDQVRVKISKKDEMDGQIIEVVPMKPEEIPAPV